MKNMGNATNAFVARSERALGRANALFSKLMTPIAGLNKMLMGLGYYVGLFTLVRIIKNAIDIFADFQQANKNLALVMGTTVKQNKALSDDARRIGLRYGEAATEVVKMQHALATLGFEQKDILMMGRPLITGASALEGADPERLAGLTGSVIQAFNRPGIALGIQDTQHILDVMTLSANRTALNFEKLATTLPIVSGPANAANVSFEETVALLGVLSNAGVHVATSATSLKNIFIDSAKKGHTYNQVIENIINNSDKLVYANKQFGKRSVVSALAIAEAMHDAKNGVMTLTGEFKAAKAGLTEAIALERVNTFRGAQKLLNATYQEFILSIEDGTGKYAAFLTGLLRTASAVLLLSSNSDQAREAVSSLNAQTVATANTWLNWLGILKRIAITFLVVRALLISWRIALFLATAAQTAFSISMAIAAVIGKMNLVSLRGNAIAMATLRVITMLTTRAQWGLNLAMYASPLIIFAIGLAGVIALMSGLNSWISSNINGMLDFSDATNTANDSMNKFYNDQKDRMLNDPVWRSLNPILAEEADKQKRIDDVFALNKGTMGQPVAARINPKIDSAAYEDGFRATRNGKVTVNFNDPDGRIKDVSSDSQFIMPKVTNTNTFE